MKTVPIFLACDEKYAKYATVTMVSVLRGTKDLIDLYVLDGGITDETKTDINMFLKSNYENLHNLEFITVDKGLVKDFPSVQHFSLNTYFRYFIADMKPEIKRALYIDSDMLILGDISELYNTDMHGFPVAAVPYICNDVKFEKTGHYKWLQGQKQKMHMDPKSLYFNAGLMIMDLDYFRKNKMQKKLVQTTIDWKDVITCPDQDILNMMFENNYEQLSPNFNIVVDITDDLVNINNYAKQFIGKQCTVIHYTGGFGKRPWTGSHVLAKYFWNVAKHTPYYVQLRKEAKYKSLLIEKTSRRKHVYLFGKKIASFPIKYTTNFLKVVAYRIYKPFRKADTVCYMYQSSGYDNLIQHRYISFDWDYVCYTNDKNLLKHKYIGIWEIRPSVYEKLDSKRNSGWHKTHPDVLFPEYKNSVWIDGNINVVSSYLHDKIKTTCKKLLVPRHHDRNCIYDEINIIKSIAFDDAKTCEETRKMLIKNKMPRNYGVNETNVMFRKHHEKIVKNIDNLWWKCIEKYSKRDQLSFSYCLFKNNINVFDISIPNVRFNNNFFVKKHNKHHD